MSPEPKVTLEHVKLWHNEALQAALERAKRWHETATPEEKAAVWAAQRASLVGGFGPCEHGDYDWETCAECLAIYREKRK
jgi:hypothetical protein